MLTTALEEATRRQSFLSTGLVEDLERTKRALHAAQASAAYAAVAQVPPAGGPQRTPLARPGYNPIAMPRRQFGASTPRTAQARPGSFQAPWSGGGVAPPPSWTSGLSSASRRSGRGGAMGMGGAPPSISCATPR